MLGPLTAIFCCSFFLAMDIHTEVRDAETEFCQEKIKINK